AADGAAPHATAAHAAAAERAECGAAQRRHLARRHDERLALLRRQADDEPFVRRHRLPWQRSSREPVMRRSVPSAALLALSFVGLMGACSGDGGSGPSEPVDAATITLRTSSFSPKNVLLNEGGSVTFNNSSGVTHNVTFSTVGSPADIIDHASGTNVRDFPDAGEFDFHCTLHAGMNGRVTVVAPTL